MLKRLERQKKVIKENGIAFYICFARSPDIALLISCNLIG